MAKVSLSPAFLFVGRVRVIGGYEKSKTYGVSVPKQILDSFVKYYGTDVRDQDVLVAIAPITANSEVEDDLE